MSAEEFMTKAMNAQAAGRITAVDISKLESSFNRGIQPPPQLVQAVLAE